MSNELPVAVRQALHGYVDGHRELWCSAQLKPRDSKSVLMYSDISSSGLQIGEGGYLTGYPLPDSGLYAVARTWPAPEMQRPGAVWTHTLFIEFSDVARIRDATSLLSLFRRPAGLQSAKADSGRDEALELCASDAPPLSFVTSSDEIWCRQVLLALYGSPESKVVALCDSENLRRAELIVLALWSQQWPRLRRAFRFCTLTSSDRSEPKSTFDLQVALESERGLRSKFPSAIFSQDIAVTDAEWLDHLLLDIEQPQASRLRAFLQKAGADQTAGRRAFVPLARLEAILGHSTSGSGEWGEAIAIVQEMSALEPSKVTQLVVRAAVGNASWLDAAGMEFVLGNLSLIEPEQLIANSRSLGLAVWHLSPLRLAQMWDSMEPGSRVVAAAGLAAVGPSELLSGLPQVGDFAEIVFRERPDLLASKEIWAAEAPLVIRAMQAAVQNVDLIPQAIGHLIASKRLDLIPNAFKEFGNECVWRHLAATLATLSVPPPSLASWLRAGAAYPSSIAQVLVASQGMNHAALAALARATHPDLVPNDYGDDPWVIAARQAVSCNSSEDLVYLCSYLLARAFGPRSRNNAALVEMALGTVTSAAGTGMLEESAWILLALHLPESNEWQSWDRRRRVLAGVGQLYVRRDLAPTSFGRLGVDLADFECLVSGATKEWGARAYLRSVRRELKDAPDFSHERRRVIEHAVSWF